MNVKKLIFVISMLSSILSFFGCANSSKDQSVSVQELHTLLQNEDIIVLDVRTPPEIAQGKIKEDALEANFFNTGFIAKITSNIPKDKNVYVYCKGGTRSGKAVQKLRKKGYTNVFNVDGDIKAWKAEGFSVE